ncbi:MAG: class II glutamine amidotransferase [Candidatus Dormibacteria bacterium]
MCELLLAVWPEPVAIEEVLPWARSLELFGLGGFGWGVAWRHAGAVRHHRHPGTLADDRDGVAGLRDVRSTHYLVHLRRPSQLTTIALADTQPFLADDASFAFAHNGRLDLAEGVRHRFPGRLQGRADSEVGFRLFEELRREAGPAQALREVHRQLGGTANLGYLPSAGAALAYAGAPANQMWKFTMGPAQVISTALHSSDQAVFEFCFPEAGERTRLGEGAVAELGDDAQPVARSAGSAASARSHH